MQALIYITFMYNKKKFPKNAKMGLYSLKNLQILTYSGLLNNDIIET